MRENLTNILVCPRCRASLTARPLDQANGSIQEGRLECRSCGASYAIRESIPRLVVDESAVRETQRSFGSQWKKRAEGRFEDETLWGLTRDEEMRLFFDSLDLKPEDLRGRRVLDAGCGSGRLTRALAAFGAEVVGLDVAETIDLVARQGPALSNLHLVQGNLLHIPLADNAFDIVWSSGVIHHTGNTPQAFANLARVVRPGGRLYVWVYSARTLTLYKYLRDMARISHRLPPDLLFYLCYASAPPIKAYHLCKFAARTVRGLPISRRERQQARIRTIAFELHDDLSPRYQTRHTPEEVFGWFERGGFDSLALTGEVGVRGVKRSGGVSMNESSRGE
ncbi:MAG TPA: methyltransferase domain-containing protein [Thermoplasmata archaeon]|nr:methyltransferase domain-containing protein [Thermoplasmata archaeon]